jgi:hypothetical protein
VQILKNCQPRAMPWAGMLSMVLTSSCWSTNAWAQATVASPISARDASKSIDTEATQPQQSQSLSQTIPAISHQAVLAIASAPTSIPVST